MYCNTSFYQFNNGINSIPVIILQDDNKNKIIGQHPGDKFNINKDLILPTITHQVIENGFFLYFNQQNVAHSMCQIIVSLYEFKQLTTPNMNLYVSECVKHMPFINKLINLLFNTSSIHTINENKLYTCKKIYIPTYIWFYDGYLNNFIYDSVYNVKIYKEPTLNDNVFNKHNLFFNDLIDTIFKENQHKYNTYENISIIKSTKCVDSNTPQRAINMLEDGWDELKKNNFYNIFPHEISDIIEFIVQLKSAKNVITSYGGAHCVNRFFFTNATIKVICNEHYKDEYIHTWHNSACLNKCISTLYFLDISNTIGGDVLNKIITYQLPPSV